ncbi:hypothetical protein [Candidatus Methanodesulfokora washburnensis]|uniref:Uncharacterized protein n=1 Tax=Candidatus Methanodesulfokora washburnensis TaxID=2478471 RepID=A0A429GSF4_9CREN|nr:hypothetical protein [Candidatus Methanodesulfokores washburnensis]RSN76679.1 hypothetical protein D6D85_03680 [Candidatus Methanodesulfokores washburnensis]
MELLEGMIDLAVYELVTRMEGVLLKDQQKLWIECKSGYLELMNLEKLRKMQRCHDADLATFYDASYLYIAQSRNTSHYRG